MAVIQRAELEQSSLADLHAIASELGVEGYRRLRREELVSAILGASDGGDDADAEALAGSGAEAVAETEADEEPARGADEAPRRRRSTTRRRRGGARSRDEDSEPARRDAADESAAEPDEEEDGTEEMREGALFVLANGSGFMRANPFAPGSDDVYVSPAQIRRCELRTGDSLGGPVRSARRSERHPSLVRVDSVNGGPAEPPAQRPRFEDLTPLFATERLPAPAGLAALPYGCGSRVSVAGPPASGVTLMLTRMVDALRANRPELELIVAVAGVRPEEVTEWRRAAGTSVAGGAFDRPPDELADQIDMAVERAKRAVERGEDVVLVIDGLDALSPVAARRAFGAARNVEEGGSLTVLAGTGTSIELERLATTRIVLGGGAAAGNVQAAASGTTRAELLS